MVTIKSTDLARMNTDPRFVPKTTRRIGTRNITSTAAGKIVPLAQFAVLPGDKFKANFRITTEMLETVELLMNPVNIRVTAYLVPDLALERFQGSMDQRNRSWAGQPQVDGGSVVPYYETADYGAFGANAVYKALGLSAPSAFKVVTNLLESYNAVVNFRRKNRSPDLPLRTRLQADLAEAFWEHSQFEHVVPTFDNAIIDGEVALNVVDSRIPIRGLGVNASTAFGQTNAGIKDSGGNPAPAGQWSSGIQMYVKGAGAASSALPDVYAEFQEEGVKLSLSNIELARKAQVFAKLRTAYNKHDEWIIDMLMDGLEIPDLALTQPILLGKKMSRFAQAKRFATDSGNLTDSAVSGGNVIDMYMSTPPISTGGTVIVFAECVPEQMWERRRDPMFHLKAHADAQGFTNLADAVPHALQDQLDPEAVEIVTNGDVDTMHSTPLGTFGYHPMNCRWDGVFTRAGGKFFRPTVDAGADDARQRFWASEDLNPSLGESFYLVKNLQQKPFIENEAGFEPFEIVVEGLAALTGNTQFGGPLIEATDDYTKVVEKAPTERIEQPE